MIMMRKKFILCLAGLCLGFITCNYFIYGQEAKSQKSSEPAELVSIDYKDAQLTTVLRALSYSFNLNLVVTKDVSGKVTVTLQNVTLDEALHAILDVNGYTFTRKGRLIYITPGPGVEGLDVVTVTIPLMYLTAGEAKELLQKTISSKGDIRISEAANNLVINDFPGNIERVKEVLKDNDIPPIQVLIEAKLVDITEKDLKNFGFSYTFDYSPDGTTKGIFKRNTQFPEKFAGEQSMAGPSGSVSGGQFKISDLTMKGFSGTVTLDALIQDNKAHLLASPSITTLNGKEARIIIGERFPYKEKTQTTTGTTEATKFVEIGTTLRVTPRVSQDNWITMSVHPEVSSLTDSLDAGPRVATREADATIRVKDGQTIIIGGLIKRQDDRVVGKIPVLGYIPILGWFFSKSSTDLTSTELVVFITPRIIRTTRQDELAITAKKEEVAVSIEGVGERAVVNRIWYEGLNLQKGRGVESLRKDKETRLSEAYDHYIQIATHFPGSDKADNALYRAGIIAYYHFKDLELAKRIFTKLIERYPESLHVGKSKKIIRRIDMDIAARDKRGAKDHPSQGNKGVRSR